MGATHDRAKFQPSAHIIIAEHVHGSLALEFSSAAASARRTLRILRNVAPTTCDVLNCRCATMTAVKLSESFSGRYLGFHWAFSLL